MAAAMFSRLKVWHCDRFDINYWLIRIDKMHAILKETPKNNMRMMEPGSDENTFEALFRFRGGTAEA